MVCVIWPFIPFNLILNLSSLLLLINLVREHDEPVFPSGPLFFLWPLLGSLSPNLGPFGSFIQATFQSVSPARGPTTLSHGANYLTLVILLLIIFNDLVKSFIVTQSNLYSSVLCISLSSI